MSNEELAQRIQAGEVGLYGELWEQTKKLIFKLSYQFYQKNPTFCDRAGITPEDLQQTGFFALIQAVEAYKPASGYSLFAFLNYPIKNAFRSAIGIKTSKEVTLNKCKSLDEPISDETDSATLGDITPDSRSGLEFEQIENNVFNKELRQALENALETLPNAESEFIHDKYFNGLSVREIERIKAIPEKQCRKLEHDGLQHLRKPQALKYIKPFQDEYIQAKSYNHTGFSAWENFGSVEENILERLESIS